MSLPPLPQGTIANGAIDAPITHILPSSLLGSCEARTHVVVPPLAAVTAKPPSPMLCTRCSSPSRGSTTTVRGHQHLHQALVLLLFSFIILSSSSLESLDRVKLGALVDLSLVNPWSKKEFLQDQVMLKSSDIVN
ncbi:hypothetical protein PIB30_064244 [Stylosanthes scabra]|uniref:Uncharacterized protein n=1 Tax=Stylosanthes scabra TaxID=79078 RepID=A0ABU6UL65_9FABA|nr:hypothetical protein [Stylosanthes scabra]